MTENYYREDDYGTILTIMSDSHGMMCFIIDNDDVERVKQHKWLIFKAKNHDCCNAIYKYYAISSSKRVLLHRFITNAEKGRVVDHLNGNTFDNRKRNLKLCTYSENGRNQIKHARKSPKSIMGVYYNDKRNKWYAYITIEGKRHSLGYYEDEQGAIDARLSAEIKYGYKTENKTNSEAQEVV